MYAFEFEPEKSMHFRCRRKGKNDFFLNVLFDMQKFFNMINTDVQTVSIFLTVLIDNLLLCCIMLNFFYSCEIEDIENSI